MPATQQSNYRFWQSTGEEYACSALSNSLVRNNGSWIHYEHYPKYDWNVKLGVGVTPRVFEGRATHPKYTFVQIPAVSANRVHCIANILWENIGTDQTWGSQKQLMMDLTDRKRT